MESRVGLGRKEGCTNFRISAKPGIEQGTLRLEGRDLTNCANHAHLPTGAKKCYFYLLHNFLLLFFIIDLCVQGSQLPRRKPLKEKRVSFGDRKEFEEVKNRINSLAPLGGITERPESRGGLAFDIIICPETGNRKKRPSHLKKLEKRKKKSKKLTKEQLEEKLKNAYEKRKVKTNDKIIKRNSLT